MSTKVQTITELLQHSFQSPTLTQAVQFFTNAFWLNKAYEQQDETLILEQKSKAYMRLQKQPSLENFTDKELANLYPNKQPNLEILSPSNLAVKRLIRESLE